ncbi:MAG: hypothetical protein AAFN81_11580 [Bacteroidota bacterium]
MKNLFFALLTITAFTVFTGCNNDDDEPAAAKTEFTYDGTTYDLAGGFLNNFGQNLNGTYDWDIFLVTEGITKNGSRFAGEGSYIYLDVNTDSDAGLVAGTYNWSNTRENFTLIPGTVVAIDHNFSTNAGTNLQVGDGTVDIAINGMETTVTFTLTLTDGKTVSGEWTGVMEDI